MHCWFNISSLYFLYLLYASWIFISSYLYLVTWIVVVLLSDFIIQRSVYSKSSWTRYWTLNRIDSQNLNPYMRPLVCSYYLIAFLMNIKKSFSLETEAKIFFSVLQDYTNLETPSNTTLVPAWHWVLMKSERNEQPQNKSADHLTSFCHPLNKNTSQVWSFQELMNFYLFSHSVFWFWL